MYFSDFRGHADSAVRSICRAQPTKVCSRRVAAITFLMASILALLPAPRAFAENITLTVRGDAPAGSLPTWYEPSAFVAFSTNQMKMDFGTDSVKSRGMFSETVQFLLGPSTSLSDYQSRLARSGLAEEARTIANAGGQLLIQVEAMPIWISSSSVTALPRGCTGEWPTYQTVAPDPAKWADWEAAVSATVTYFNVTNKLSNVWYQFWEEPDGPCYWTATQAKYLETWQHFAVAARRADPNVRIGGPASAGGPDSIKPGESVPLMKAFIDYSAANGVRPSFITYHIFEAPPEDGRLRNRTVRSLLNASGLAQVPIVVSGWNPTEVCYEKNFQKADLSWPSPPSALGCWQTDTEMGASYSLALMSHLSDEGAVGYQTMYMLDDANIGGTEEFPHDWGMRTSRMKNGIRKALYHAQTLVGRLPRNRVVSTLSHANGTQEDFAHFYSVAGVEGDKLSMLVWSYVTSPGQQSFAVLKDMGYGTADIRRWGGLPGILRFVNGQVAVSSLTGVPKEQADLQTMKQAYYRQRELVTENNRLTFAVGGFPSTAGYQVTRYLIDASNNNSYATYVGSGLAAAIAGQKLQVLDTRTIGALSEVPSVDLKPYSVMLIEIVRKR